MAAYYNEFKPEAAHMLRQLISDGLIAPGDVDERSIIDVQTDDLRGYEQCHFFAGIGGWSVALRLADWPDNRPVWTGSCPCQPFSPAGEGKAQSDERHLWPHWRRLIIESKPATLFGEQVEKAIAYGWLDDVLNDLEAEAYACAAIVLPACSVQAPHERQRIWFMANAESDRERREQCDIHEAHGRQDGECLQQPNCSIAGEISNTGDKRLPRGIGRRGGAEGWIIKSEGQALLQSTSKQWDDDFPSSKICCVADGILGRTPILHAFGNAIVPQVAAEVIKASRECIE